MRFLIDMDGPLADLHPVWLTQYNMDYADDLRVEDIKNWGMTDLVKPECGDKIFDYLRDPSLYAEVPPTWGALDGIEELRYKGHDVHILTSNVGPEQIVAKVQWLADYGVIDKPIWKGMGQVTFTREKHRFEGDVLLDDSPNIAKKNKARVVLWDAPWNQQVHAPRVDSWEEFVYDYG